MIQIPEQGNNSKVAKDLQTKAVGRERERERERESKFASRSSIRKFPYLRNVIEDGFDYKGFCTAIDSSTELNNKGKAFAKGLFNPNKRVISAIIRGQKRTSEANQDLKIDTISPYGDTQNPIAKLWKNVWYDTKDRYERQVADYDVMIERKSKKKGISASSQYPHLIPEIMIENSKTANAAMLISEEPILLVSKGFLALPPSQQKAVLYHEANHAFEPVLHKIEAGKYIPRRLAVQGLTINAISRYLEHKADANAAAFGHAKPLSDALNHITESHKPGTKKALGDMSVIAKAANESGFSLDKKKVSEVVGESVKFTGYKQQFLRPAIALGGFIGSVAFNSKLRSFATQSKEQLLKKSMSGKMWIFKVGTHPQTEERIARLLGNSSQHMR